MRRISFEQAEQVYDILVRLAGAPAEERGGNRYAFAHHVSKKAYSCDEYRFCGRLGFGGKFRNNGNNRNVPYVDCYREDETPERLEIIRATNEELARFFAAADLAAEKEP